MYAKHLYHNFNFNQEKKTAACAYYGLKSNNNLYKTFTTKGEKYILTYLYRFNQQTYPELGDVVCQLKGY